MSQEKITKEQVLHIATLSNLTLSEEEVSVLSEMLTDTVSYIKILEELDTKNVEETYQVTGKTNVFQKNDTPETTLSQKKALSNAHEVINGYFATKAVFER